MNEKYKSDFKIRIDEDEPARSFLHSEVENQQINKLRKRVTFMSVFTLCLLALALTFAYIEIKKQMGSFHVSGSNGFETLSRDVESRFSSLSVKYAEVEARFSEKIIAMEKSVTSVKTSLDKTAASLNKSVASLNKSVAFLNKSVVSVEKTLKKIQSSKIDKKALSSLKKDVSAKVITLQKEMENLSSMLQNTDSEHAGELAELRQELKSISRNMVDLQDSLSDLAAVSIHSVTKKEMKANLHVQSLGFQNQVDELTTLLNRNDDKIEILISRIENLKKDFIKIAGIAPDQPAPAPKQIPESSENKLTDDSAIIDGGVKEQNIQ